MATLSSRIAPPQVGERGFAFIESIFEQIDASELVQGLDAYRWTGRRGYSPEYMWRAALLRYLLNLRHTRDLIAYLNASPRLRLLCGFRQQVPSESTFSRFFSRLVLHQAEVDVVLRQVVELTGGRLKHFGREVAIDSTDIKAFARGYKHRRKVDREAEWGIRTSKDPKVDKQHFYGYKLHLICDARYGVPLSWQVLPANANDSPQLPKLFDQLRREYPNFRSRFAIADRGYDSGSNYRYLHEAKIGAVIGIRNTDKSETTWSLQGFPRCIGGLDMDYHGTDREKGHLFRCPEGGCHLNDEVQFSRHCDSEFYEKPETDSELRKVGHFARANPAWQRLYNRRGSVERLFGSAKQSRLLDTHRCFGIQRVRLHVVLSLLAYTGTMAAHVAAGDPKNVRQMDVRSTLSARSAFAPLAMTA